MTDLWKQIWSMKIPHIVAYSAFLTLILVVLFLKDSIAKHRKLADSLRYPILLVSFLYVGLYLKSQPTVMNIVIFFNNLKEGSFPLFTLYMLDPFIFLSFIFIAATMILWGRGGFCGWLCPYGAMLELLNKVYRKLPFYRELNVPYRLHWKLVYLKYAVFFIILAASFLSFALAEYMSEVEPFKTFILKLKRDWYFVAYFAFLTIGSVVVYRAFCRYLCPLGGAIALPSLLLSRWIPLRKIPRYELCRKCVICAASCGPQAIKRDGRIDRRECLLCLECHENFWDEDLCPVLVRKKRGQTRGSGVFLVSLLLLLFSAEVFGATLRVGKGGDFNRISDALAEAKPGDTILVNGGTYRESLLIEKRVYLKGVNDPVIEWEGTDSMVFTEGRGYLIGIRSGGVVIEGFTLRHLRSGGRRTIGIIVEKADDVVIRNNRILDTFIGVRIISSNGVVVENNYIEGERDLDVNQRGKQYHRIFKIQHTYHVGGQGRMEE